ncbi:oxidoreductase [Umezawaea beigongshangensis]|uniref:oxidoreductase n=1 Tax=Umezawaea beigongshangensis TaxID=2780383 RepID=UPI0018F235BE|nr:oxidoreductase [Umezawaea beigongshangensis]
MPKWSDTDVPDQTGRTVLITGANSGLGLRSAEVLASRGARVLLACRSPERGRTALERVRALGDAELVRLDLADLASVRAAAADVRERTGDSLHVLMNNAGVMAAPRGATADGFERQFGTNHLGHAALTWLLMPALRATPGSRVVTLSSLAHRMGGLSLHDPNYERRRYAPWAAYGQAKFANLLFSAELDRRLRAAGDDVIAVAAHPGLSRTELGANAARSWGNPLLRRMTGLWDHIGTQRVEIGALPQLYAATAPGVDGGDYFGPDTLFEMRGHPKPAARSAAARDPETASKLWELTARLTGVTPDPA